MTALPNPESHDQAVRLERELWQRLGRAALDVPRRGRMRRGVGRDLPNEPADVAQLELLLGRAGYYDLDRRAGPTGWWSPTIEHALRKYQKDQGLTVDGWVDANGESVQALTGASTAVDTPAPTLRRTLLDDDFRLPAPTGRAAGKASLLDPDRLPFDVKTDIRRFLDPRGEDTPPNGEPVQVAIAPIIAAGGAVAARVIPHITRNAPIIAGTIGKVAQDQMGRTTPAAPLPPLPPSPIPEPARPDIVSTPIIEHEPTTFANIPPRDLPQGWIEIFPDQSNDVRIPIIVESRGSKDVESQNTENARNLEAAGKRAGMDLKHVRGAFDPDGSKLLERLDQAQEGAVDPRGVRSDTIHVDKKTGVEIHTQSVDVYADGLTPTKREKAAIPRIIANNRGKNVIVRIIPKAPKGSRLDPEKMRKLDDLTADLAKRMGRGESIENQVIRFR